MSTTLPKSTLPRSTDVESAYEDELYAFAICSIYLAGAFMTPGYFEEEYGLDTQTKKFLEKEEKNFSGKIIQQFYSEISRDYEPLGDNDKKFFRQTLTNFMYPYMDNNGNGGVIHDLSEPPHELKLGGFLVTNKLPINSVTC